MNQARAAQFNLTRLAESLLPLINNDPERAAAVATERLEQFTAIFKAAYSAELRRKFGLFTEREGDLELAQAFLQLLSIERLDYTQSYRYFKEVLPTDEHRPLIGPFSDVTKFHDWVQQWRYRLGEEGRSVEESRGLLAQSNPVFIPRNHRVEEAIRAATVGDLGPFERLQRTLQTPYLNQPEFAYLAQPPGDEQWSYQTFCGT